MTFTFWISDLKVIPKVLSRSLTAPGSAKRAVITQDSAKEMLTISLLRQEGKSEGGRGEGERGEENISPTLVSEMPNSPRVG